MENEDVKTTIQEIIKNFGNDLAGATDACSAGTVGQTYAYALKDKLESE